MDVGKDYSTPVEVVRSYGIELPGDGSDWNGQCVLDERNEKGYK